eukprot:9487647-Pyramimonas_sp.AAC.1
MGCLGVPVSKRADLRKAVVSALRSHLHNMFKVYWKLLRDIADISNAASVVQQLMDEFLDNALVSSDAGGEGRSCFLLLGDDRVGRLLGCINGKRMMCLFEAALGEQSFRGDRLFYAKALCCTCMLPASLAISNRGHVYYYCYSPISYAQLADHAGVHHPELGDLNSTSARSEQGCVLACRSPPPRACPTRMP